jgi:hypothetical protein
MRKSKKMTNSYREVADWQKANADLLKVANMETKKLIFGKLIKILA